MKTIPIFVACAIGASFTSCSTITTESGTVTRTEQGVPGGEFARTTRLDATVTAIDSGKRNVKLVSSHGEKFDVDAGPEVMNFHQIRIGDPLTIVMRETLLVRMAKPGEKLDDIAYTKEELARIGDKPGMRRSTSEQYVATVTAIDTKKRKATLRFSDGSEGKFDIRPDVDLSQRKVGEKVLLRSTESLAVSMKRS